MGSTDKFVNEDWSRLKPTNRGEPGQYELVVRQHGADDERAGNGG